MTVLSAYDQFQFENRIKPDFCNTGFVVVFDEELQEWVGWEYDGDAGYYDDVDEYIEEVSDKAAEIKQFQKEVLGQVHF